MQEQIGQMESTWMIQPPQGPIQSKAHPEDWPIKLLIGLKKVVCIIHGKADKMQRGMKRTKPRILENEIYVVIDKWSLERGMVERQNPKGAHYRESQGFMVSRPLQPRVA
jgi:hypothetical protein